MPNQNPTNTFNPEIRDYFLMHEFIEPPVPPIQGGLLFMKRIDNETVAVQFWRDRIEVRRGFNFELQKSYQGFDGQDIVDLMWLMHIMKVITLEEVKRSALTEQMGKQMAMAV